MITSKKNLYKYINHIVCSIFGFGSALKSMSIKPLRFAPAIYKNGFRVVKH